MKRKETLTVVISIVSVFLFFNSSMMYAGMQKETELNKKVEPTEVETLEELREKDAGTTWKYTGEAVITAFYDEGGFGYLYIFIADETAAILLRDFSGDGNITTEYDLYDVITGILGEIALSDNRIMFSVKEDPGAPAGNIPVSPTVFSFDDITWDPVNPTHEHQSKLVKFENVFFNDIDVDENFEEDYYTIEDDNGNTFTLRAEDLYDYDGYDSYVGTPIPHNNINITGIIWQGTHSAQIPSIRIIPRFLQDFTDIHDVTFNVTDGTDAIEGADVSLTGYGSQITDAGGVAVFENVETASDIAYNVTAVGYNDADGTVNVVDGDITEDVTMSLTTYEVTFNVTDGTDAIQGATVALTGFDSQTTDAEGVAIFEDVLPANDIAYTVTAVGYDEADGTVDIVDDDVTEDVTLSLTTYGVTFNVTDGADAIEGATVSLTGYDSQTTDAGGVAIFEDVAPEENIEYTITADGYNDAEGNVSVVDEDVPVDVVMTVDDTFVDSHRDNMLNVFPNPASSKFTVTSDQIIKHIRLINISGQVVKDIPVNSLQTEIYVDNLHTGIYFVQIQTNDGVKTMRMQISR